MKKLSTIILSGIGIIIGISIWIFGVWQERSNPYTNEDLTIKWNYGGATSSYPWIDVFVNHGGKEIRPSIAFGGIEDPQLRFRDYDGDGYRDIIFEDDKVMQVVAFFPVAEGRPPRFEILRNDVTSP